MSKTNKFFNYKFILIALLSMSCNTDVSIKQKLIAGSDYKLWQEVKDTKKHKGSSITYWYFDRKGKCQLYKKYKDENVIVKLDMGDVILIEKWSIINKNNIDIFGKTYQIDLLNDTCFSFRDTAFKNQITTLIYKNEKLP